MTPQRTPHILVIAMYLRRTSFAALLLSSVSMLAMAMAGCVPHHPGGAGSPSASPPISAGPSTTARGTSIDRSAAWPFWPVSMNVHPLTRLTMDDQTGRLMLEARLEFLDSQGNRSKAVGDLELMLFNTGPQGDKFVPVVTWTKPLRDAAVSNQHFDVITRTYLLRLELDPSKLPAHAELRAEFDSLNGQEMKGALKVPRLENE